ncbi:MAG TPA: aminoacyl-tRNA hydrolase [Candidatus Saccharibacteria bacterium]|nr:aminoacyl-tRNA hydrolase [Candidatus Saccharibacteria bacterium]HRK94412.1 aminoacyl-tRNA hydrolase [Candidatus Saccharibacteria bacterium]
MKIVFGLGNPGSKYVGTRHNTGFLALDAISKELGADFSDKPKFNAEVAEFSIHGEKVLLVKPQTFYNEAGRSYRSLIDFYKVDPADTLVIHDELALPFGTIRIRHGGSDAGNNGIKSINQHGGASSVRMRIGVENASRSQVGDVDFVLSKFTKDEAHVLERSVLAQVVRLTESFLADSHQPTSISVIDK